MAGAMNHYQQQIEAEIRSVQGQKDYCLATLAAGGLKAWQSKEFRALVEGYDQLLMDLNNLLPLAG